MQETASHRASPPTTSIRPAVNRHWKKQCAMACQPSAMKHILRHQLSRDWWFPVLDREALHCHNDNSLYISCYIPHLVVDALLFLLFLLFLFLFFLLFLLLLFFLCFLAPAPVLRPQKSPATLRLASGPAPERGAGEQARLIGVDTKKGVHNSRKVDIIWG